VRLAVLLFGEQIQIGDTVVALFPIPVVDFMARADRLLPERLVHQAADAETLGSPVNAAIPVWVCRWYFACAVLVAHGAGVTDLNVRVLTGRCRCFDLDPLPLQTILSGAESELVPT
jgi:hypothetical protein